MSLNQEEILAAGIAALLLFRHMGLLRRPLAEVKAIQRHQQQWVELDLGMNTSCYYSYIAFWVQQIGFLAIFRMCTLTKSGP